MKQEIDNTQVEDKTDKSTSLGNNVVSELWPLVQNFIKIFKKLKNHFWNNSQRESAYYLIGRIFQFRQL